MEPPSQRAFATVVTRSYLPYARVLADSLRDYHAYPVYVVCIDPTPADLCDRHDSFILLTPKDIVPADELSLLFYYSPFEACNALRAYLHRFLLENTVHERWLYLDSDILVLDSLEPAFSAIDTPATGLISPHCLQPAPQSLAYPVETSFHKFGIYNSGVLGLRRSERTVEFVKWFTDRLRWLCFSFQRDCFVDQLWLNFVPVYFPTMRTWTHPGANVGYWNLHERVLQRSGRHFIANGEPLLFVHFSRWVYEQPADWRFGRPEAAGTDDGVIRELGLRYRELLDAAQYSAYKDCGYGYESFTNGRPVTTAARQSYYERLRAGTAPHGNPFEHPEWFPRRFAWADTKQALKNQFRRFLQGVSRNEFGRWR